MPTTIYDSSFITQRKRERAISGSFINRIQNPTNPTTGSPPLLGTSEQSIINTVKTGQMTQYRKNNGCVFISPGCPCPSSNVHNSNTSIQFAGWASRMGYSNTTNVTVKGCTSDSTGVYIVAYFNSNVAGPVEIYNFDSAVGDGSPIITSVYGSLNNIGTSTIVFIVKYDTNGQVVWVTSVDGGGDQGLAITVDSGNLFVTGTFKNSVNINSADALVGGVITPTFYGRMIGKGEKSCFVVKYDANDGVSKAATCITCTTGSNYAYGYGLAVDNTGNLYLTGSFKKDINPISIYSFGIYNPPPAGLIPLSLYGTLDNDKTFDCFIIKYNNSLVTQWVSSITGTDNHEGFGIATDGTNVYVTGYFSVDGKVILIINSAAAPNPVIITPTLYGRISQITGRNNCFIVKYDATNGAGVWATIIDGNGIEVGNAIAINSTGVYITGSYSTDPINIYNGAAPVSVGGAITPTLYGTMANNTNTSCFIIKYDSNGAAIWATNIDDASANPVSIEGKAIAVDSTNVYVTGYYSSLNIGINSAAAPNPVVITPTLYGTMIRKGNSNCFIVAYSATNGTAVWATSITGNSVSGIGISTYSNCLYVSGTHSSDITINRAAAPVGGKIPVDSFGTLASIGNTDGFIVKYRTDGQI